MRLRWIAFPLASLAGFAGWLGYIGYFGGPVFTKVPAAVARPRVTAILLSGDMGFKVGMGPKIARRLAADGIPVLGVSSLTYFRHERTPAEVEALVSDSVRRALAFGHTDRLILIGQSFGADMLHVGLAKAPPALRARIGMVALVVPTDTVFYRASPSELFNWAEPDAWALPTARLLDWVPLVCVRGEEETDSLCPLLTQANARTIALPGGHPLHHDDAALYGTLKQEIVRAIPDAFPQSPRGVS